MFAPHVSPLNASPHRQRIIGAQKSHLGDEELGSVSPKKLFSDLRGKSTGRAFGDKTNASPSRSRGQDGFGAPGPSKQMATSSKPSKTFAQSRSPSPTLQQQQERKGSGAGQLGSPAKAKGAKSQGVVFLGAGRSPSKQKGKTRERSQSPSKRDAQQEEAPLQPPPPPVDDASYATLATPAPAMAQQKQLRKVSSFVTPASNVGEAGARRLRHGELMDALAGSNIDHDDAQPTLSSQAGARPMTEEEMYPEIEYMAPSHYAKNPPFDFHPRLDGLPRGKELGEALAKCSAIGFYRPTASEKDQMRKQRLGKAEVPALEGLSVEVDDLDADQGPWPDVVKPTKELERGAVSSQAPVKKPVSPLHRRPAPPQGASSTSSFGPAKTVAAKKEPSTAINSNRAPVKPVVATANRPRLGTAAPSKVGTERSSSLHKSSGTTATAPPRQALKPKNSQQMHPLLRNVQDDDLGKQIDARLHQQSLQSCQGFLIDE